MDTRVAAPATSQGSGTRPLEQVPGPRPWPLLGNLPQIDPARMHAQLEKWVDDHGPVYRISEVAPVVRTAKLIC